MLYEVITASGTMLGPYRIEEPLGAGGMGEVYRATDTRLKRDVAIKVLPAAFTADHERLVITSYSIHYTKLYEDRGPAHAQ